MADPFPTSTRTLECRIIGGPQLLFLTQSVNPPPHLLSTPHLLDIPDNIIFRASQNGILPHFK